MWDVLPNKQALTVALFLQHCIPIMFGLKKSKQTATMSIIFRANA